MRRKLERVLAGRVIQGIDATVERLRRPVDLVALRRAAVGRAVVGVRRRAKYLLWDLAADPMTTTAPGALALLVHLGMSGSFRSRAMREPLDRHDRVILTLGPGSGTAHGAPSPRTRRASDGMADGAVDGAFGGASGGAGGFDQLRFHDPRRFGSIETVILPAPGGLPACLDHLGIEPLARAFDGAWLHEETRRVRRPIKPWIMDQTRIVGVGNIYASEALFRAGIDPRRAAGRLSRERCGRLARAIKEVLRAAIRKGGTTLSDYRQLDGQEGKFRIALRVYGLAETPCPDCGAAIRRIVQTGRSTFFCPRCQR